MTDCRGVPIPSPQVPADETFRFDIPHQ